MPIDPRTGLFVPRQPGALAQLAKAPILPSLAETGRIIPRAAEGLVRGTLGLVDILPGINTGVAKEENFFFKAPESLVGGALTTILQLAVPLAAGRKLALGFLAGDGPLAALNLAKAASPRAQLLKHAIVGTVSGATADFVAFGGQQERLSNFVHAFTGDPITGFLEANPDDPELQGRLKNVLEGAGIGFAFDMVLGTLAAHSSARKEALKPGKAPEAIVEAFKRTVADKGLEEKAQQVLEKVAQLDDQAFQQEAEDLGLGTVPGNRALVPIKARKGDIEVLGGAEAEAKEKARRAAEARRIERKVKVKKAQLQAKAEKGERLSLIQALQADIDLAPVFVKDLNITPDDIKAGLASFEEMSAKNQDYLQIRLGGRARKLSEQAKGVIGLALNGQINLRNITGTEDDVGESLLAIRVLEKMLDQQGVHLRLPKKSEEEMVLSSLAVYQDITQQPLDEAMETLATFVEKTEEVGNAVVAVQSVLAGHAHRATIFMDIVDRGGQNLTPQEISLLTQVGLVNADADTIVAESMKHVELYGGTVQALSLGASNLGRALRARQVPASRRLAHLIEGFRDGQSIAELRNRIGEAEFRKRVGALASLRGMDALTREAALARFLESDKLGKGILFSTEWVINSLLSAPKTLMTNFLFPTLTSFYHPLENVVGGALTANGRFLSRELRIIPAMFAEAAFAAKAAKRAFQTEFSRFDPGFGRREGIRLNLISSEVIGDALGAPGFHTGSFGGHLLNFIGQFNRYPARFMAASDEFVKTMIGRGYIRADLTEQAVAKGLDPTTAVPHQMDQLFDDGVLLTKHGIDKRVQETLAQEGIEDIPARARRAKALRKEFSDRIHKPEHFSDLNPVVDEALKRARDLTATGPLDDRGLASRAAHGVIHGKTPGGQVEEFVKGMPVMRLVLPFVRTPVKLARFAGQRVGGPLLLPDILLRKTVGGGSIEHTRFELVREALSGDRDTVSQAVGKINTGAGIFAVAVTAAQAGYITGGGPLDAERRKSLQDAGWLPYSFYDGKGYTQFVRADPFAIQLGIAADLVEITRLAQLEENSGVLDSALVGMMGSIARNLTNRSYLTGLVNFLDAITTPERAAEPFAAGAIGAFLPRGLDQAVDLFGDPVLRDTHGLVRRVKAQTPFLSGTVPPLRNVLGDPIQKVLSQGSKPGSVGSLWLDLFWPIAYREVSDDVVLKEFVNLRHGFSPPLRRRFGIRIDEFQTPGGQDGYDRWQELQGQVKLGGRNLRQELRRTIRSRDYQQLDPRGDAFNESPRVRVLRSIVSRYREEAFEKLRREIRPLDVEITRAIRDRNRRRAGLRPSQQPPETPPPFAAFSQ